MTVQVLMFRGREVLRIREAKWVPANWVIDQILNFLGHRTQNSSSIPCLSWQQPWGSISTKSGPEVILILRQGYTSLCSPPPLTSWPTGCPDLPCRVITALTMQPSIETGLNREDPAYNFKAVTVLLTDLRCSKKHNPYVFGKKKSMLNNILWTLLFP